MKPSQMIAIIDIDDAYDKLHGENETLRIEKAALSQALDGMLNIRRQLGRVNYEEQQALDDDAHKAAEQVLGTLEV